MMTMLNDWWDLEKLLEGTAIVAFNKRTKCIATKAGDFIDLSLKGYSNVSTVLLPNNVMNSGYCEININALSTSDSDTREAMASSGLRAGSYLDVEMQTDSGRWMTLLRVIAGKGGFMLNKHGVAMYSEIMSGEALLREAAADTGILL